MSSIRCRHAVLALLGLGALTVLSACGGSSSSLARTGEVNSMGMPVVETPGTVSGTLTRTGLVMEPVSWSLGRVPLNVAVRPSWMIRNTGTQAFSVGQPTPEIRQGCCPGPFALDGPSTVPPGGETRLFFELSMHPGMDGPHDIAVQIPITYADGTTATITGNVAGEFRN